MEDFSICLADPESIYVEHDLNLVLDKFSVKLYLRANVNKIVELNISPVYRVVQSSFHDWLWYPFVDSDMYLVFPNLQ